MGKQISNLDEIRVKLLSADNYVKDVFYVQEIGVFGSFVTGKQKKKSDVDILVTFAKGHKDLFNFMRLKYYLEELLGHKVDLVIKEAVKERLKNKIFSEVVYVR